MTLAKPIVPVAVALLLMASSTDALPAQAGIPAGTWRFVPEESEPIDEGVDRAVEHLNFLIRGIARSRLKGANEPISRIVIQYPGDDVHISIRDDEPPMVSPRTGEAVPYTRADGEVVQVLTEVGNGTIRQVFDSDDGQKEHLYRLRADGMMELEVTVFSERLRDPFTYTWVFRR